MATQTDSNEISISHIIAGTLDAYRQMDIRVRWYLLGVLLPSLGLFVGSILAAFAFDFPVVIRVLIVVFGFLIVVGAVIYPRLVIDRRRIEMENKFHLLVTHMTVLSTTNIDRVEVFRRLGREVDEYGELAIEMNRIVQLVDTWNQSLDDACRRRAQEIPSDSVSDFFDRLAYTIGAGQRLDEFLLNEQNTIIQNYSTIYQSNLENLGVLKDLYLSIIISMTFGLVFAIVLPILTGTDPTMTVSAVLVMFAFVQLGFVTLIKAVVPYDPVWFSPSDAWTRTRTYLLAGLALGGVLSFVLVAIMLGSFLKISIAEAIFPTTMVPRPLYVAIPITPLLLPGLLFRRFENQIQDRDDAFPNFIRALGATESVKQSTTSTVLTTLRKKDFGALTENIENLYRRLNMRLDDNLAWAYFAAETQSYLIEKFSDMYLVGREIGGDPKQLGELIGKNMNAINQLRERRSQEAVSLIGILYGISVASAFSFFIGLEVVGVISGLEIGLEEIERAGTGVSQLLHPGSYDLEIIEYLILVLILFNSLLGSLLIRISDGGHKGNSYLHFVVLTWIACLTGYATKVLIGMFMSI
ncbi:MAG: archaellar assembly protein FlaJ [Natronomonas sp.]